jgi:TP901 family phage tail tape measure protein
MAATLTSSLIVRLIDQVTSPARKVGAALVGLNRTANGVSGSFGARLGAAIERNNAALDKSRGRMVDAIAGFYALKEAIGGPVRAATEFESAMSDVRKVVDFPTPEAFKDFQAQLIALSKQVPLSVNGLAQIAAAAGQAGIAGPDLIKFTEAAAKVGVAFDISADQAGDAMAKLMTGLGLTIDQTVSLSDAMNYLSNAQASSAAEILDVVRRVGAQAKQFGFTAEQVAAFGSAMVSAGAETDVAATSFRNMGLALTHGEAATKSQRKAYAALGMDAKKVAKDMQKDAVGTTLKVMEAIAKLPKDQQASVSSELFGNEARALPILLTNLKLLKDSLGLISDQSKYAGSSFKEYDVRAKTFANAVQLFQNRLTALKIVIGAALIPALNDLIQAISPVIDRLTTFAQAHPELTRNVLAAAGALIAFKIATTALTFAGLLGRGGALTMLSIGFNTVGRAAIGASTAVREAVGLQMALGAMSGQKLTGLQTLAISLRAMVFAVPGVSAIASALGAIGGALAAISAPVWGLIALGVAAVAAAGALLWKYWDRVSSVVSGFASRIGQELAPAIKLIQPAIDALTPAVRAIGDGFAWAQQKLSDFAGWLGSFFNREVLSDDQKAAYAQAGADLADSMINAVKSAFDGLVEWFRSLPGRILSAIGSIDLTSLIHWPSPPGWWTRLMGGDVPAPSAQPAATDTATTGHRAKGGPVWPGSSFLVGENGPERFTPSTQGTVSPGGGGMRGPISVGPFHFHGIAGSPAELERAVRKGTADALNQALRGAHSDSGAWD